MRRFFDLLVANIKMSLRNRQAIFWMFVFPVLLMSLFGIVFSSDERKANVVVVNNDDSALARSISEGFEKVKAMKVKKAGEKGAISQLKAGKVDAVLVFEKGFASNFPKEPAKINFYYDPSATFISAAVRSTIASVLSEINQNINKTPRLLALKSHSVRSKSLRYIDFLVPGIIAMTLMNSALFGLGGTIVGYRERGILRRLKVTPQPLTQFIAAQISNQLIFSIIRALLLILVAKLLFGVNMVGNWGLLFLVVIIGSLTFVTLAFTIASFSKNREVADTLGNIITMPMMFLGGVFFPVDSAPSWIKPVIRVLPLRYLADAMRDVMVKGEVFANIQRDLGILLAITFVFFLASVRLWRWE